MSKETLKRHAISAGITFATGFLLAILPFIESTETPEFTGGIIFGVVLVGLRAGLKASIELLIRVATTEKA